jgi:hypothetical protein
MRGQRREQSEEEGEGNKEGQSSDDVMVRETT